MVRETDISQKVCERDRERERQSFCKKWERGKVNERVKATRELEKKIKNNEKETEKTGKDREKHKKRGKQSNRYTKKDIVNCNTEKDREKNRKKTEIEKHLFKEKRHRKEKHIKRRKERNTM